MTASEPAQRFRAALDLYEVGEAMLRQRLKRDRPEADEREVDGAIQDWLRRRPGAEHGDHPGPRSSRTL